MCNFSTLSSVVNSMAAVGLIDIIQPCAKRFNGAYLKDTGSVYAAKIISKLTDSITWCGAME